MSSETLSSHVMPEKYEEKYAKNVQKIRGKVSGYMSSETLSSHAVPDWAVRSKRKWGGTYTSFNLMSMMWMTKKTRTKRKEKQKQQKQGSG